MRGETLKRTYILAGWVFFFQNNNWLRKLWHRIINKTGV